MLCFRRQPNAFENIPWYTAILKSAGFSFFNPPVGRVNTIFKETFMKKYSALSVGIFGLMLVFALVLSGCDTGTGGGGGGDDDDDGSLANTRWEISNGSLVISFTSSSAWSISGDVSGGGTYTYNSAARSVLLSGTVDGTPYPDVSGTISEDGKTMKLSNGQTYTKQ